MHTTSSDSSIQKPLIFVSYAHADRELVLAEMNHLVAAGFNIWLDDDIAPGENWRDELASAIRDAGVFLFLITPNSINSAHCRREVSFALDIDQRVLCVYLTETELPDGLRFALNDQQALRRSSLPEAQFRDKLIRTLSELEGATNTNGPRLSFAAPVSAEPANGTEEPRLLVLPLTCGDSETEQFMAEGIADDIVTSLARSRWIKVFDASTSLNLNQDMGISNQDPRQIAAQLGAAFVLHGRMRRMGANLRATIRLTEVETGNPVWAEQLSYQGEDLFELEAQIRHLVLGSLEPEYLNHQSRQITENRTDLRQWEMIVKARHLFWQTSQKTTREARQLLEEALTLQRNESRVYSLLAMTHLNDVWNGWSGSVTESLKLADSASMEALRIDSSDPSAHHVRSAYTGTLGDLAQARASLHQALELNPEFAAALGDMARILAFSGELDEAVSFVERAIAASPKDPHVSLWCYWAALTHFQQENWLDALHWLEKSASVRPDWVVIPLLKACCLGYMKRTERAKLALSEIPGNALNQCLRNFATTHPFADPDQLQRIGAGLQKAGLSKDEVDLIQRMSDSPFNT